MYTVWLRALLPVFHESAEVPIAGEQYLCAAILRRAIADALGQSTGSPALRQQLQRQALEWIFLHHPWFVAYCDAVGVDPRVLQDWVRRHASAATQRLLAMVLADHLAAMRKHCQVPQESPVSLLRRRHT